MPETNFFWDPLSDNILQERDETGTVTAEYTTEPGLYGNLISQNRQGEESQYHFDVLGSTLALTDDTQQVTDTYGYTAFGEVTVRTGTTANLFQHIGKKGYLHQIAGECLVRRRVLLARTGRWLTYDPIHIVRWGSPYQYARNAPLTKSDPSGLLATKIQATSIAAANALALPSPSFKHESQTCKGCGNYDIMMQVFPTTLEVVYYVQIICFEFEFQRCKSKVVDCSGRLKCTAVGDPENKRCCIVELLGLGSLGVFEDSHIAKDRWQHYLIVEGDDCLGKGYSAHFTFVYGFDPDSASAKAIAAWPQWKKPVDKKEGQLFPCGTANFRVGQYFDYTTLPKELLPGSADMVEYGTAGAYHEFDCCPMATDGSTGKLGIFERGIERDGTYFQCNAGGGKAL